MTFCQHDILPVCIKLNYLLSFLKFLLVLQVENFYLPWLFGWLALVLLKNKPCLVPGAGFEPSILGSEVGLLNKIAGLAAALSVTEFEAIMNLGPIS